MDKNEEVKERSRLICQSAYGTDFDAFSALLAPRPGKGLVFEGGDYSLRAPVSKTDGANFQSLPADPYTSSAENALVGIADEDRTAVIDGEVFIESSESFCLESHPQMSGDFLEFTGTVLLTVAAVRGVGGQKEFGRGPCQSQRRFPSRPDNHPLPYGLRAGSGRFIPAFHLHKAKPTGAKRFFPVLDGAEVGDIDTIFKSCPEDLFSFDRPDSFSIDGQGYFFHFLLCGEISFRLWAHGQAEKV